jgi:hypothetical protein
MTPKSQAAEHADKGRATLSDIATAWLMLLLIGATLLPWHLS